MNDDTYRAMLARIQAPILDFLRALEDVQQTVLFQHIASARRSLATRCDQSLEQVNDTLADTAPPAARRELHAALCEALSALSDARDQFVSQSRWADFARAFLTARNQQCRALEIQYRWRADLHAACRVLGYFCPTPQKR